jgi:amidohydrolase
MIMQPKELVLISLLIIGSLNVIAQGSAKMKASIDSDVDKIDSKVVEWRHHLHENAELSNREYKTAEYVAKHLESLGIEVQTGVAHTGVVGVLKGGKPGPVIGLRADMDGLPVTERVEIPWASKAVGEYNGVEVGVMHACGHDTHVAILMATAEILASMKSDIKGTIKFIFQPAEEGAPAGEEGGAKLMIKEGTLKNPDVDVIFGLHINSKTPVGHIGYKPGGALAAVNSFTINVKGKQTHGSAPWAGIDPIVTSAMIINGLQTIVSRQTELTKEAAVVSIGSIHGGVRSNIIPEEVEMVGTIRTLDTDMQTKIHKDIKRTAISIAESQGAVAEVTIDEGFPITYNDPDLTAMMLPSLQKAAGSENVHLWNAITGAEDFSFFQKQIPGFFFFLGGMPAGTNPADAAPHHTPDFYVDDAGMSLGIKTFCYMVFDYAGMK